MRVESGDRVKAVAASILAALVKEAAVKGRSGPFALDDFLHAWLEHESALVEALPDAPGSHGTSQGQRRTYWFYEGCKALEEDGAIAEVGDGKFAVASLPVLMTRLLEAETLSGD